MDLTFATPIPTPPIITYRLISAAYTFSINGQPEGIIINYQCLTSTGAVFYTQSDTLTPDQVTTFFATSLNGMPDFRTVFATAFAAYINVTYGAATVTSS